jgi:hypothetical protein
MGPETAPDTKAPVEKKARKKKAKLKVGDFTNKGAYYDACIKQLQDAKAEWQKYGDGDVKKKATKAKKFIDDIAEMKKDPRYADIIADLRKELNAPVAAKK